MLIFLLRAAGFFALLAVLPTICRADDRSVLEHCKIVLDRAAQAGAAMDQIEVERCRIVVREWTLRDSRMLVDEQGKSIR